MADQTMWQLTDYGHEAEYFVLVTQGTSWLLQPNDMRYCWDKYADIINYGRPA